MKLTFLGTGTSNGVPVIGCNCEVCRSEDPRDNRLRASALLETDDTRILIDCGPDFRQQILPHPFRKIDGILITHIHYDHAGGIDDVRPYCQLGDIDVFANDGTCCDLRHNLPYCFTDKLYPGVPRLQLHSIEPHVAFRVGSVDIMPLEVMHGALPILGFRFGRLAYITDMKTISPAAMELLQGVEVLVINGLRWERPHHSHLLVGEAVEFGRQIGAAETYLTHLTHNIGLHDEAQSRLPEHFHFAYDGLQLDV